LSVDVCSAGRLDFTGPFFAKGDTTHNGTRTLEPYASELRRRHVFEEAAVLVRR
jgi:hypothetical protein